MLRTQQSSTNVLLVALNICKFQARNPVSAHVPHSKLAPYKRLLVRTNSYILSRLVWMYRVAAAMVENVFTTDLVVI